MTSVAVAALRRKRIAVVAALIAVAIVFHVGILVSGDRGFRHVWADFGWTAVSLIAAIKCLDTARRHKLGHLRLAWDCFALGCAAWFAGMVKWDIDELVEGRITPFPTIADAGFWAIAPMFALGYIFYKARQPSVTLTLKNIGDLGVVGCVLVMVSSLLLYGPTAGYDHRASFVASALAYPVLHLTALLFGMLCLWQHVWGANRWVMSLQLVGMATLAGVTTLYASALLSQSYEAGQSLDVGWVICFALIIWSAFEEDWLGEQAHGPAVLGVSDFDALVPALAVGSLALAGLFYRDYFVSALVPVWSFAGLGLAIFLGLRTWATHRIETLLRDEVAREQERRRLVEASLLQAQKMEAIGALAGGVAHEFKNLITGMTAGVAMVRRKQERGQDPTAALDTVEHCLWRAGDVTSRLLDLARRREPATAVVDPAEIIERMVALLSKVLPRDLEVVGPGDAEALADGPALEVDVGLLEQALLNLALNARDAMKERGGTLRFRHRFVEGAAAPRPGRWIAMEVSDTGHGMTQELVGRIFEPFFTTKALGEGTGLGLAMVHAFAAEHHGWVDVESEVGRGTTFTIYLPALAEPAAVGHQEPVRALAEETVLVVGESDALRLAGKGILEECGYQTVVVASGAEALDELDRRRGEVDLVVTDAALAEMGGLELVRTMRGRGHEQPMILATAVATETPARGREFAAVVRKPFQPTELAAAVRRVLDAIRGPVAEEASDG